MSQGALSSHYPDNDTDSSKMNQETSVALNNVRQNLIGHSKTLKQGLTLDEEFFIHQVHEARAIINAHVYNLFETKHPDEVNLMMSELFNFKYEGTKMRCYGMDDFIEVVKDSFSTQGHLLLSCFGRCMSNNLPAVLIKSCTEALVSMIFGVYFHMHEVCCSMMDQEKITSPMPKEMFDKCIEEFPWIVDMPSISMEDYLDFATPWAKTHEEEEYFKRTTLQVGRLLGTDMKLASLATLLLLLSPPSSSPLARNKNLKTIRSQVGNLMYRHLLSREGYTEAQAAEDVHKFRGYIEDLYRCSDIWRYRRLRLG